MSNIDNDVEEREWAAHLAQLHESWKDSWVLTPRQAASIAMVLDGWADTDIDEWLRDPSSEPLHEVDPFAQIDKRVMMLVGENRAWAALASERCHAVAEEIANGVLPFDRPGCYFDELLMALALPNAEVQLTDCPELFEGLPPRIRADDDSPAADDEWDSTSDGFDDQCRWDEWEVPTYTEHPLLPALLAAHHPYHWFDIGGETGAGYLQRLGGLTVEAEAR